MEAVRGRRRGRDWTTVSHGLHVPAGAGAADELAAWQLLLPSHGCFTHLTGAAIREWWLPEVPDGLPVLVALRPHDVRPDRAGIRSLRTRGTQGLESIDGLRVAPPGEVLLACARDISLLDLTVLVDGALYAGDRDDRGVVGCRWATPPGRTGVSSSDRLGGSEVGVSVGDGAADLPSGVRDRCRASARGVQRARCRRGSGGPLAGGDDDVPRVRRWRPPRAPPPGQRPSPRTPTGGRVLVSARLHLRGPGQRAA